MLTPPVLLRSDDEPRSRVALLALLFAFVVAGAVVLPRLQAKLDAPLAVVFPPWWSAEASLTAAALTGVDIMGAGATPNILIVRTGNAHALGQLYRQGAWSVLSTDAAPDCETPSVELRT